MRSYSLFVVAVPLSCAFSPCPPLATSFAKDRKQPFYLFMSESQDGEVLQSLFAKQCDPDGLMTKETLTQVQSISDLLVRFLGYLGKKLRLPLMKQTCSRITPRQCRIIHFQNEAVSTLC
jgi:hypothetical protein